MTEKIQEKKNLVHWFIEFKVKKRTTTKIAIYVIFVDMQLYICSNIAIMRIQDIKIKRFKCKMNFIFR